MVRRFNRIRLLQGVAALFLSLTGYGFAAAFVWLILTLLSSQGWNVQSWLPVGIVGFWGVTSVSGWRRWRSGSEGYGPADSLAFFDLDEDQGGAWIVQNRAARIFAPAYVLGQVFLAGPVQMLKGVALLGSRLPDDAATESRLGDLLAEVRARGSWHPLEIWTGRESDISALIRMGRVEFSSAKGRLRATP